MVIGKFVNEDLSVYYFIFAVVIGSTTVGAFARLVDGYPFMEIEDGTLSLPTVSVEASLTSEEGGELGAAWFRRNWTIDIFAQSDVQRDDMADNIFRAVGLAIPIRDYSGGFRKETGLSLAGAPLRIIEWMTPENRTLRPTYAFNLYQKIKYWRTTVTFETVSTQAN